MGDTTPTPGWEDKVRLAVDKYLDERLGPAIAADAERYAPKKTGKLAGSIHHVVADGVLYVRAEAPYAGYVELGHRNVAWGHFVPSNPIVPAEPYLRPALYQQREV